jgi:hypothetical protein
MMAAWVFGLLGLLLALGFFVNGMYMDPSSAFQQEVQYLSWIAGTAGLIILTVAAVVGRLEQILRELRRLNPGTEGKPETEGSSGSQDRRPATSAQTQAQG